MKETILRSKNFRYLFLAVALLMIKLLYFPMGSTTLKNYPYSGKEPDTSYSFGTRKTSPDLAVEVIYTSGNIDDSLTKYKYLQIKEVWFWKDNKINFYRLVDNDYLASDRS